MPTVLDLGADLVGQIPGLPRILAHGFVNQALHEIKTDYLWSWNINEGILITPASVSTGTVAVTQFSNKIQFDVNAQAALTPLLIANPPITQYQFRQANAPIYNIIGYDDGSGGNPAGTAFLDRIYMEASGPESTYFIVKCYYGPPSIDGVTPCNNFLRYLSITNPLQGYTIAGRRLYMTREELNRRDPLRGAYGLPYYAAAYRPSGSGISSTNTLGGPATGPTSGQMMYELWPHPSYLQEYLCQYEMQHVALNPGDYIPAQCPPSLVRYRTKEHAYRWAMQNQGRIPELRGVDWRFLLAEIEKKYAFELVTAKKNDKEIMLTVIRPGSAGLYDFWGPIDSNFFQSHGLPAL